MLSLKESAEYCGTPVARFKAVCPVRPVDMSCNLERYDMRDLDNWIDGLKGGVASCDDVIERLS
jgi:hypothetical protein